MVTESYGNCCTKNYVFNNGWARDFFLSHSFAVCENKIIDNTTLILDGTKTICLS